MGRRNPDVKWRKVSRIVRGNLKAVILEGRCWVSCGLKEGLDDDCWVEERIGR